MSKASSPWTQNYALVRLLSEFYDKPGQKKPLSNMLKKLPWSYDEKKEVTSSIAFDSSSNIIAIHEDENEDLQLAPRHSGASITTLPHEILLQIFEDLDWADLLHIFWTCRNINQVVLGELYRRQYFLANRMSVDTGMRNARNLFLHNVFSLNVTYIMGSPAEYVAIRDPFLQKTCESGPEQQTYGHHLISYSPWWNAPFCNPPMKKIILIVRSRMEILQNLTISRPQAITVGDIFSAVQAHAKGSWLDKDYVFKDFQWCYKSTFFFTAKARPDMFAQDKPIEFLREPLSGSLLRWKVSLRG